MIVTEVYAYVPEVGNEYIGMAYSSKSLYDLVQEYWKQSEYNEKIPLVLYRVNKKDKNNNQDFKDKNNDRDFKDWEADQQYKWFVEGNDKDLFED